MVSEKKWKCDKCGSVVTQIAEIAVGSPSAFKVVHYCLDCWQKKEARKEGDVCHTLTNGGSKDGKEGE